MNTINRLPLFLGTFNCYRFGLKASKMQIAKTAESTDSAYGVTRDPACMVDNDVRRIDVIAGACEDGQVLWKWFGRER